ncbi:MAG: hypothetical protein HY360_05420 [Verrucomicrobia bacterium]|nr:hypothetical protein [Verrucomicrobiota bacterium]
MRESFFAQNLWTKGNWRRTVVQLRQKFAAFLPGFPRIAHPLRKTIAAVALHAIGQSGYHPPPAAEVFLRGDGHRVAQW